MKSKKILSKQARPGMVVASDIFSSSNQLIIPKNSVLTDRAITRLQFYSIREISVVINESKSNEKEVSPIPSMDKSYSEIIKGSVEYKRFNNAFLESVTSFKSVLSEFVESGVNHLNLDSLLELTNNVLSESRNGVHVFHMLHCMRDYDDLTFAHSLNVSLICNIYGKWLNLPEKEIDILTLSGLLHDIGKLLIPKSIISKPSPLNDEETAVIQTHPMRGYNLLKDLKIDPRIKYSALMHHEKCDGSGYPNGFSSDHIDAFAKIITVIDVYDAMTSARVYRDALCPFEVINIFESEGLQKYDPTYLLPFLKGIVETYLHNQVTLNDGRIGEIVMINPLVLSKPMVHVGDEFIDLSKEIDLYIQTIV
jgi:HD-GYP domain-containing protein (c-di-GMP phosphodiesterase class II)